MAQNRKPPSFQEYPEHMLTDRNYRTLSLAEKGLLGQMRYECWRNQTLPSDPEELARFLGLPVDEVSSYLPALMARPFFKLQDNEIVCPELEDYRRHLDDRKRKQSDGGKKGSAITNERLKAGKKYLPDDSSTSSSNSSGKLSSTPSSTSIVDVASNSKIPRRVKVESLVQSSTEKPSQNQDVNKPDSSASTFIKEMDEYEHSNADYSDSESTATDSDWTAGMVEF